MPQVKAGEPTNNKYGSAIHLRTQINNPKIQNKTSWKEYINILKNGFTLCGWSRGELM